MARLRLFHFPGCSSAWLERCVRDAEVAGSNPVTPISIDKDLRTLEYLLIQFLWQFPLRFLLIHLMFGLERSCRPLPTPLLNRCLVIKIGSESATVPTHCTLARVERSDATSAGAFLVPNATSASHSASFLIATVPSPTADTRDSRAALYTANCVSSSLYRLPSACSADCSAVRSKAGTWCKDLIEPVSAPRPSARLTRTPEKLGMNLCFEWPVSGAQMNF